MSSQQKDLLRIGELFARMRFEVEYLNSNALYDINIVSEDILIPVLNIAYNCNLKNVKYTENSNQFPGIDLLHEGKIAFQITSDNSRTKIKETLDKVLKYKIYKRASRIYILIIGERLKTSERYNISIKEGKFKFDDKNIIDLKGLFSKICSIEYGKIVAIKEILEKQFSDGKRNVLSQEKFNQFKTTYYNNLQIELCRVNFFGLSIPKKPREIELQDLFVSPRFQKDNSFTFEVTNAFKTRLEFTQAHVAQALKILETSEIIKIPSFKSIYSGNVWGEDPQPLPFKNLYDTHKNFVILGNPGAGKSSLVKYTILKIIQEDKEAFANQSFLHYIPFRIELFKYNNAKRINNCNVFQYLSSELTASGIDINTEELLNLFATKRTVLFFDGLDEIFDLQERLEVRNDIEKFSKASENTFTVVTSRFESYREVFFNDRLFDKLKILDFNDDQIEDYIERWYKIEEQNLITRKKEIEGCLLELRSKHSELKRNPLLLSLIVILYRNQQELPPSKFDIYEGCTKTIVETRDEAEKKLRIKLSVSNKIATFSDLAFWQFSSEETKIDINYTLVKKHIKNYLLAKEEIEDDSEAEKATDNFLEFAKTRSVYFENKFTHKTFLEYFTAYYIFSSFDLKSKREKIIRDNLNKSSWSEILELLICKIDKEAIDFIEINKIADIFIQARTPKSLVFLLNILKYIQNIAPRKISELIKATLRLLVIDISPVQERLSIFNQLVTLSCEERFQAPFAKAIKEITKEFNAADTKRYFLFYQEFQEIKPGATVLINPYELVDKSVLLNDPDSFILENISKLSLWENYFILLANFLERFGKEALLKDYESFSGAKVFFQSTCFNFISNAIASCNSSETLIKNLESIREFMTISEFRKLKMNPEIKCFLSSEMLSALNTKAQKDEFLSVAIEKLTSLLLPFSYFSTIIGDYSPKILLESSTQKELHKPNLKQSRSDRKYNSKYGRANKYR